MAADSDRCPVLEWAASGAMWLTGPPGGPPLAPSAPVLRNLGAALEEMRGLAAGLGSDLPERAASLVTERASSRGFRRRGQSSLGGHCRLIEARDGWVAVNLARPEDVALVPAAVSCEEPGDPWAALGRFARSTTASGLAARAQLVGIPAAALPKGRRAAAAPYRATTVGAPVPVPPRHPLVVNASAMWAGPLCAHLLAQCGATVVKVEDPHRPDGARWGDPWLFGHLNAGAEDAAVDFSTTEGRQRLRSLVARADIVIEGSRPRVFRRLGLDPRAFLRARPGRTWVSVTGYGRTGPWAGRVAFGDDAAVAGGLVAWSGATPVFCADAVADPATGIYAALGALRSWARGGGDLVDVAMHRAAAFANRGPGCPEAHPVEHRGGDRWVVHHRDLTEVVRPPAPVGPELDGDR